MKKILLESPVYTLEAALLAVENGVDRLELCADFGEGGTTPSLGLLKVIKSRVEVPVFVMIRPRGGDFVYSELEIAVMKEDIKSFLSQGADGFVFGILNKAGKVNQADCLQLVQSAEGKPCTFHRAFDVVDDKKVALEEIIQLGFKRILTSGGENSVMEGMPLILNLLMQAKGRIIILPGGGLMLQDIADLNMTGLLKEIHASCKQFRPSALQGVNDHLRLSQMEETEGMVLTVAPNLVKELVAYLKKL
ncbi:copper homeostasis protein CutC [Cyclobacterium sp. 1_MG-2023]|uniref:copper homeostasis protein CutC n=1 Tax=Cyclobacterium sp. 1_MG-2023 TaxID=3062681 RepID=UPI0026E18891|nr:copper homeostasis protein CutC [Cyclobacterium sp. 1_MG-2023]MDO6436567.1 copper homeostasis protein CutC [Cyclobacterium sp. 1_MG-2023]